MKSSAFIGIALGVLGALGAASLSAQEPATNTNMTTLAPDELKWFDGPPALPKGVQSVVLYGDPGKPGLFMMRAKFPANYKIPAHWHPADENVTVLSGTLFIGHGDKLDTAAGKPMAAGSFVSLPAQMHHYAYTQKETMIELVAMGPFGITYINPADDPTKAAATK